MDIELKRALYEFKTWSYLAYFGLILLIVKFKNTCLGSCWVAVEFGVSDLIIGLTIVCSWNLLPELAASVIAARKR